MICTLQNNVTYGVISLFCEIYMYLAVLSLLVMLVYNDWQPETLKSKFG